MKRIFIVLLLITFVLFFYGTRKGNVLKNTALTYVIPVSYVKKNGMSVKDRILVPDGYKMNTPKANSFASYIQNYKLKDSDAKVINYDGTPYLYQKGHVGVLEIPVPRNGLQQCADALMRLRAEYLWEQNRKDEIRFNFTSGHYCSWKDYAEGYRPSIKGNQVAFRKTAEINTSRDNFYNYLNLIYTYAGTQSLYSELPKVTSVADLQIGDMLIKPGFPGHVVMIATICENEQGERLFSLLQGNTPAQSVHLLKNPEDSSISPWFELKLDKPLQIPTYYFEETKFMRFK